MTLLSDYQARYSTQLLTNWSNPQDSTPTTPDTTQEGYAADAAQADFEAVCGVTYSSSNATHVSAAVPLVAAKLQVFTGHASEEYYDNAIKRCKEIYRLVLGRDRIMPTTNSTLSPTAEEAGSKPSFDSSIFNRYVGGAPGGSDPTNPI